MSWREPRRIEEVDSRGRYSSRSSIKQSRIRSSWSKKELRAKLTLDATRRRTIGRFDDERKFAGRSESFVERFDTFLGDRRITRSVAVVVILLVSCSEPRMSARGKVNSRDKVDDEVCLLSLSLDQPILCERVEALRSSFSACFTVCDEGRVELLRAMVRD